MDDSYSPYNLMAGSESPASPLVAPDSWGQGKGASDKISNGTNINWPPGTPPLSSTAWGRWTVVGLRGRGVYRLFIPCVILQSSARECPGKDCKTSTRKQTPT